MKINNVKRDSNERIKATFTTLISSCTFLMSTIANVVNGPGSRSLAIYYAHAGCVWTAFYVSMNWTATDKFAWLEKLERWKSKCTLRTEDEKMCNDRRWEKKISNHNDVANNFNHILNHTYITSKAFQSSILIHSRSATWHFLSLEMKI